MVALVTGGAGFIGSSLARRLVTEGRDVRVVDNLSTGRREMVPEGVEFLECDLLDLDALRAACRDVDIVFHQAAVRSVPRSVDEPLISNAANVTGTLNMLVAADDVGVERVVYASSSSVYGDHDDPGPAAETLPPNPRSPYAVSKLSGEYYCRVWDALGRVQSVSLRYFNVFGPGQHPESKYAAVFPAFIAALQAGRAPTVHWDGEQTRDFTYIDDVVEANLRAAETDDAAVGRVFNVGSGDPKSVNEVLKRVSESIGTWIEPEFTEKRAGDVRRTFADIERARTILGWQPTAVFSEAVEATVAWFAGN